MQAEAIREWQMQVAKYADQKAFEQLYTCFYSPLLRFARSFTPQNEAAEAVVDEVFVGLWEKRAAVFDIHNLQVYLFVAVRNRALNFLSWKSNDVLSYFEAFPENLAPPPPDPETLLMTREMADRINKVVVGLPPKCRIIFKLIREERLAYGEVAEILKISPQTVDTQMTIAVRKLAASITLCTRSS